MVINPLFVIIFCLGIAALGRIQSTQTRYVCLAFLLLCAAYSVCGAAVTVCPS